MRALEPYDAWVSGIRRDQSPTRAGTPKVAVVGALRRLEAAPARRLGREARLGVHHRERDSRTTRCTRRATGRSAASRAPARSRPSEEERAGRWAGSDKLECGIHHRRTDQGEHVTEHIYAHEHPESDRRREGGFTLWFTGLSGSGKSTIAHLVGPELERRGLVVEYLDGDTVRTHLSKGLGFSKEDRDTNIERIGWVASRLTRQGGAVIAAAISPYEETRRKARAMVEEWGSFVEVHVQGLGRGVRAPRRQGPLREGVQGRDQGLHGRRRPVRGAGEPGARRRHRAARAPRSRRG